MTANVKDWPYTVELIDLSELIVDHSYQRPPQEAFVEKMIQEFDETLVGTLDVSEREDGTHAILDGAQRFAAVQKWKTSVWCAVYTGMSIQDEAMFFYRKNRNRRSVHPFYQFRALMVTGDKTSLEINRIVESEGYKLGIGAGQEDVISAIRAVEGAHTLSSLQRSESLSATLHVMRLAFWGRRGGKEGSMILGLARFFQNFSDEEIDMEWLAERLAGQTPMNLLGRAEDQAAVTRQPRSYWLARHVAEIYNRNRQRGQRLSLRMIQGTR